MTIRKTTTADLPAVMEIYKQAREMMAESGNPNQWANGYPSLQIIESDIAKGISYVCKNENRNKNRAEAVFCFDTAPDPTYEKIEGAWLNNKTYGVVHRIARAKNAKGAGAFCLKWCFGQIPNIRIDTHKDNAPMIKLLNNLEYKYCGIIWLENGEERLAFQKVN
jgi:hypothetical protein